MSLKGTSKLNKTQYSWNTPNLECFHLVIQLGSTDMNDSFGLVGTSWPGIASCPLYKKKKQQQSGYTEGLLISKLWHRFKISHFLTDLCLKYARSLIKLILPVSGYDMFGNMEGSSHFIVFQITGYIIVTCYLCWIRATNLNNVLGGSLVSGAVFHCHHCKQNLVFSESPKNISYGGLLKFLAVPQIYPLSNQS